MPEPKEMTRSDSEFDQAARLAAKAMDHAHRHRSPLRPRAYEVWYTYVAGEDPALRTRVDSELIKTDVVDLDTIEQIYEEHFLHKRLSKGMTRIGDELDAGLRDTIAVVRDSLGSNQHFLASLKQAQGKIAKVSRNHDAKRVVMDLLDLGQAHAAHAAAFTRPYRHICATCAPGLQRRDQVRLPYRSPTMGDIARFAECSGTALFVRGR